MKNEPAFPMSQRDFIALVYMATRVIHGGTMSQEPVPMAEMAYKAADAMLAQREK